MVGNEERGKSTRSWSTTHTSSLTCRNYYPGISSLNESRRPTATISAHFALSPRYTHSAAPARSNWRQGDSTTVSKSASPGVAGRN